MIRLIVILFWVLCQFAYALDSDVRQPATLEADDFEIDFNTGIRIYRGNVVFQQGSLQLNCQKLTTYLNDDDQLDKAICLGNRHNPGRFKQRPEHQEQDLTGVAGEITIDQISQLVMLQNRAQVIQGDLTMSGKIIIYNLSTQKVRVASGDAQDNHSVTDRPRLVIQPAKKRARESE